MLVFASAVIVNKQRVGTAGWTVLL